MRMLSVIALWVPFALTLTFAAQQGSGCEPVSNVRIVCGPLGPEDLVPVPGGEWVLTSGLRSGTISLVNVREKTSSVIFPTTSNMRADTNTYASCPGPLPQKENDASAHGLALAGGGNGVHRVYVVHHGSRESIEVFEFDSRGKPPVLTWIGCAVAPDTVVLNSVAALPEGGFVATSFVPRPAGATGFRVFTSDQQRDKIMAGENSGELWEWHLGTGWRKVPGSEASGPNGVEISKDGKWFYIASWGSQFFTRLSRGQIPAKKDSVTLGFRPDNIRWAPDGSLLVAGQGGISASQTSSLSATDSVVVRVEPNTLALKEVLRYSSGTGLGNATSAIQIGRELWVIAGGRIALFPAP